jgi:uncharacterized membrane protein YphA (DoxX/SURF4 family)
MFIATIAVTALLAVAFTASGIGKLAGATQSLKFRDQLHVPNGLWRTIGALEIGAVLGLLAGFAVAPLATIAATGAALLMAGAITVHARERVMGKDVVPAAILFLLSVSAIVLRLAIR